MVVLMLLLTLVVPAVACWKLYVHPHQDQASAGDPADAIVALGGAPELASQAERLFAAGVARHLVLSDPYVNGYSQIGTSCPAAPATPAPGVTCFQPSPSTTRGEAQEIGRLARLNGWDDVIVMAPVFQISRARYIVGQCYDGRLRMIKGHIVTTKRLWLYEFGYQSAGFGKALLHSGC